MSAIIFELALIATLTIVNGLLSGSEIAIVSVRKIRLEQLSRKGNTRAQAALRLANSPNDFLSTVQIGITLIGILSGAVGGAILTQRLEALLKLVPALAPYSGPLSFGIVVTSITYLSLVIGELLPKRLALNNPEQIACAVARPMQLLAYLTSPLVRLLSTSTDGLIRLLGVPIVEDATVTEEEIKVLMEQGTQAGTFEEVEQEMVSRVFRLGDRPVKTIMTPRVEIVWLDLGAPDAENRREIQESPYSRFPVADGSLDECKGIVRVKDLLTADLSGIGMDLNQLARPAIFIAEGTRILDVLENFRESGTHIALITDEYGGIEGLVTLNDVIEAIVGELPSDDHDHDPQVVQREDGSWLLDGLLSVDRLKELVLQDTLPKEEAHYQTLGGFIMAYMERIPTTGEYFEWGDFRFEVVDMDGTRVDRVLLSPTHPNPPPPTP